MSNATPRINLTIAFRSQKRPVSKVPGVDYTYIQAEMGKLIEQIRSDFVRNVLKEEYAIYLYGENFITYQRHLERLVSAELSKNKISNYHLQYEKIGTPTELTTFPDITGIKVVISTMK